jgi:hypothetical protein
MMCGRVSASRRERVLMRPFVRREGTISRFHDCRSASCPRRGSRLARGVGVLTAPQIQRSVRVEVRETSSLSNGRSHKQRAISYLRMCERYRAAYLGNIRECLLVSPRNEQCVFLVDFGGAARI